MKTRKKTKARAKAKPTFTIGSTINKKNLLKIPDRYANKV